jgi:hypothetical protein
MLAQVGHDATGEFAPDPGGLDRRMSPQFAHAVDSVTRSLAASDRANKGSGHDGACLAQPLDLIRRQRPVHGGEIVPLLCFIARTNDDGSNRRARQQP